MTKWSDFSNAFPKSFFQKYNNDLQFTIYINDISNQMQGLQDLDQQFFHNCMRKCNGHMIPLLHIDKIHEVRQVFIYLYTLT